MRSTSVIATALAMVMLGASLGAVSMDASGARGDADAYGYAYTDSKLPEPSVPFSWVDITGEGTPLPPWGDDEYGGPYPIGFDFYFYGLRYSMFNLSTNGFMTFGEGSSSRENYPIPSAYAPNNIIAPFWDDLYVDSGEMICQVIGSEPNRQFVLEWSEVDRYGYSGLPMTFEVILEETTGHMWFQYLTLSGWTGDSATVGIENSGGTTGVQYGHNQPVLEDSLAIMISRLPVVIGPSQAQEAPPDSTAIYELTVMNLQPFSDTLDITCSFIEGWPVHLFNDSMGPLQDTDLDGVPDVGELPPYGEATVLVSVGVPAVLGAVSETTNVTVISSEDPLVSHSCTLTTSLPPAWFEPPHADHGRDLDDDGLYDYLVVEVTIHARTAGWYFIYGELMTPSETSLSWAGNDGHVEAWETGKFVLEYYGYRIRAAGEDGPYSVLLHLHDSNWTERAMGTHETEAYRCTDFEDAPGRFALPFEDTAVDEDLDGFYDYLQVDVHFEVGQEGRFRIDAGLLDHYWTWLEDILVDEFFSTGLNTVQLRFDPWQIRTQAADGPFRLWLVLDGEIGGTMVPLEGIEYETGSYEILQFERPPVMFEPPHGEHIVDDDLDTFIDTLVVEVSLNVTAEGDYAIQGILRPMYGGLIDTVTVCEHLVEGLQTVEMPFPGFAIWYQATDGPYVVELLVTDGGRIMDTDTFHTQDYAWTSFDDEVARFAPPHSSQVVDTDGDALYDLLVVEVSLDVVVSGTYEVLACLFAPSGSHLGMARVSAHMDSGSRTVELTFSGSLLYGSFSDGVFYLELHLYDSSRRYVVMGSHSTEYLSYEDFGGYPASFGSPHQGYACDDDGDSLYDEYVVNLTVVVQSAGTYFIRGTMWGGSGLVVSEVGAWCALEEGTRVAQVSFPGWMIYANGFDGAFSTYFTLHDDLMTALSGTSFSTSWYEYGDFDPAPPRLESALVDSPPVVDGLVGTTEWSDAVAVDLGAVSGTNRVPGSLLVMNDETTLYVCIDAFGDTSKSQWDAAVISFDTANDGVLTHGHEDEFWLQGESQYTRGHMVYNEFEGYWVEHCNPFKHDGLKGLAGFGASTGHPAEHRMYEFAIPLALLGASAGDAIGFLLGSHSGIGLYDYWISGDSWWPAHMPSLSYWTAYGELQLAAPIAVPPPSTIAEVAGIAGTGGWYLSGVNVTLSATGGDGGVARTEYRLDGGTWTAYAGPISVLSEGTSTIEYRSADNAGQVEASKSLVVKIDRVAPSTVGAVSGTSVWLNATDATSGVGSTMYRLDLGTWQPYTGTLSISGEGTHEVEYYSVDVAGNAEPVQSLEVEVEKVEGGGALADLNFYMVLAIIALITLIAIGAIFGMRRRAKESEARAAIKDIGTAVSQMMDEGPPKPPKGGK